MKLTGTLAANYLNQTNQSKRGVNIEVNDYKNEISESFNSTLRKERMTNFYTLTSNPK